MFIQNFVASLCLFAFLFLTLPQSSSELGGGKCALGSSIIYSNHCFQEFPISSSLDELWWDRRFQRGYFQCVFVCSIHSYLSTHPWKVSEIHLLNFPFHLRLPVSLLLWWLGLWLGIICTIVIDKWLSRDIHVFSVTGMLVLQFKKGPQYIF